MKKLFLILMFINGPLYAASSYDPDSNTLSIDPVEYGVGAGGFWQWSATTNSSIAEFPFLSVRILDNDGVTQSCGISQILTDEAAAELEGKDIRRFILEQAQILGQAHARLTVNALAGSFNTCLEIEGEDEGDAPYINESAPAIQALASLASDSFAVFYVTQATPEPVVVDEVNVAGVKYDRYSVGDFSCLVEADSHTSDAFKQLGFDQPQKGILYMIFGGTQIEAGQRCFFGRMQSRSDYLSI